MLTQLGCRAVLLRLERTVPSLRDGRVVLERDTLGSLRDVGVDGYYFDVRVDTAERRFQDPLVWLGWLRVRLSGEVIWLNLEDSTIAAETRLGRWELSAAGGVQPARG